jgi:hypothetical protein
LQLSARSDGIAGAARADAADAKTGDSTITCEPILKAPARKSQVGTYTPVLATSALASTLNAEFDSHHIVLEKTLGKTEVQDHVAPNWTWPFR